MTGRSADPVEVGGLHHVVLEPRLSLFADNRKKDKVEKLIPFMVSRKMDLCSKVTQ
jgi:hypothetical protein